MNNENEKFDPASVASGLRFLGRRIAYLESRISRKDPLEKLSADAQRKQDWDLSELHALRSAKTALVYSLQIHSSVREYLAGSISVDDLEAIL